MNYENVPSAARTDSVWPTVVGIIAVVFGVCGLLQGCMGTGMAFAAESIVGWFQGLMEQAASQGGQQPMPMMGSGMEGIVEYKWQHAGLSLAQFFVAGLLLLAGIRLLKRDVSGRAWSLRWAWIKIPLVVAFSLLSGAEQRVAFAQMAESADPNVRGMFGSGFGEILGLATAIFGIVWGLALPVFMLIWFGRKKIRAEVEGWGAPATADAPSGTHH